MVLDKMVRTIWYGQNGNNFKKKQLKSTPVEDKKLEWKTREVTSSGA